MTRRHALFATAFVTVASVCLLAAFKPGPAPDARDSRLTVSVHTADHFDRSIPLRSIPPIEPSRGERHENRVHKLHPVPPGGADVAPERLDVVRQASIGPAVAVVSGLSFDGVGVGFSGPQGSFAPDAAPPDTNGAAGATQYVQWVNESFAVFDKATGGVLYGPALGRTLWQGFGGRCESNNDGDPIAQYDKAANRWVLTQFAVGGGPPFLQCVAVSTSSDATGSYNRYAFAFDAFNDYPKLGVWPDGYYISFNMFQPPSFNFLGSRVCAMDRGKMLVGGAATIQCFQLSPSFGGLLPSDLDGSLAPPAGSPNFFLSFGTNVLNLWKLHADFVNPANATLTGPTTLPVSAFTEACGGGSCVPQSDTRQRLDSLGDRLMYRLAYRRFADGHDALVVNHSVATTNRKRATGSGIRWYEVRNPGVAPTLFQQGTFAPDASYRWMGSMAMDKAGNIAVGYSVSSATIHPAIRFSGRTPADALGTLQAETSLFAGAGSQLRSLERWGDYSSISVDPTDDCTLWYTTEYLKANGTFNWSTRIGSFKFPSCS